MFKGAEITSYNISWALTPEQSPDKDLKDYNSLSELRKRSRQANRDNPVVAGFQQVYINMIASRGPTIYSASKNKFQRDQINKLLENLMPVADMTGTKSLEKIIESIVSCSFIDGDVLVSLPIDEKRDGVQTVVELIEAHRVQTPVKFNSEDKDYLVRHGCKYDKQGRLLGHYVRKAEKVDSSTIGIDPESDYEFIPVWADDKETGLRRRVSYLFEAPLNPRPLASRQYPVATPLLILLKHMDDFHEAVIVGARVAACFAGFVTTNNPAKAQKSMVSESATETLADGRKHSKIQPGSIFYLNPNEEISFASPNKPSDNTDSFMLRNNKLISMYFRVPYAIAFLDTEQVSYSSWRGAVIECYKMINRWRRDLNIVIDLIVKTWVVEGISKGLVRGSLDTARIRKRWPSQGNLDMEKEARGNNIRLNDNKTISRQMVCDEEGIDFNEVQEDRFEEMLSDLEIEAKRLKRMKELEAEYGIKFEPEEEKTSSSKEKSDDDGYDDEENKKERRKKDGNW